MPAGSAGVYFASEYRLKKSFARERSAPRSVGNTPAPQSSYIHGPLTTDTVPVESVRRTAATLLRTLIRLF